MGICGPYAITEMRIVVDEIKKNHLGEVVRIISHGVFGILLTCEVKKIQQGSHFLCRLIGTSESFFLEGYSSDC